MKQNKKNKEQCEHSGCPAEATHEVMISVESRRQALVWKMNRKTPLGFVKVPNEPPYDLMYYCLKHTPTWVPVKTTKGKFVQNKKEL